MKLNKSILLATAGLGAVVLSIAFSATAQTSPAAAPPAKAAAPEAAPAASTVPRFAGNFTGQKVDAMAYVPTCPKFTMGLDAAAIQESTSRTYIEGEARKLSLVRDQWDAYDDCIVKNAERDIEAVRNVLSDNLSNASSAEATSYNAMTTAANVNAERIGRLAAPKAAKAVRGAAAAAAGAAPATPATPTVSAWTPPTGRVVGTLSGTGAAPNYQSGCPNAIGTLTPASFASEATRAGYEVLLSELRAALPRIEQVRTCRSENGQKDYDDVKDAVNVGVNAVFGPARMAFEREYAAVQFQINEHKKPGGVLAPPEMGRRPAATKTKAKKK